MKKIMNKAETFVIEMCNGIVAANPELSFNPKYKVIYKKNLDRKKVSIISGGGSGHEPAHAGFVKKGMLDAAVCGDVFASPSQIQVYQGLKLVKSQKGTLMIIKNYSGDVMNFKNGAALAKEDDIKVDYVIVNDDIAVEDSLYTVGRRGVGGTVFVHKVAGAAAELGWDLSEVKRAAEKAISNTRSIGFALTSCTVPAKKTPTFQLGEDDMEYGVGIHGEPGIKREKVVSADELSKRMTKSLIEELDLKKDDEIGVLVNGFGGTPLQELFLLNNSVMRELAAFSVLVRKCMVGNYMTSIDMAGASLTFIKLDDELKKLLDANDINTYNDYAVKSEESKEIEKDINVPKEYGILKGESVSLQNFVFMVDAMCHSIIKNEIEFCNLDSHAGDGDFGMSLAKGFKQLQREWDYIIENHTDSIRNFLEAISLVLMEYCGGASGPIWGSAFRGAARSLNVQTEISLSEFADMLEAAMVAIQKTGERSFGRGAVVGDKTIIDALSPCVDAWKKGATENLPLLEVFRNGAQAAVKGAESTKAIIARMGRAGTVGERSLGFADAGAFGLGVIFTDVVGSLE